jgi:hypothetical protein
MPTHGVTLKERGTIELSRERLEDSYQHLSDNRPLGPAVQRHGEEIFFVSSPR